MLIRFWGVRGSLPSPMLPSEIRAKIAAVLDHLVPEDIASAESRQRFLAGLPPWIYGTAGGNTPCVSVEFDGFDHLLIFDCGTGIRELGADCLSRSRFPSEYHIFLSHFHWDHLQGLPFFNPAYNPAVTVNFYSPDSGLERNLKGVMDIPYFPIQLEQVPAHKNFHLLSENNFSIGPAVISFKKMSHPGDSFSYMVSHNGKKFIYATDTELSTGDFLPTEENTAFFKDADVLVLDAQYTLGEAIEKYNWGHSAFSLSVDFAANWGIKHLILFHHDPTYDDHKLYGILQSAQWYLQTLDENAQKTEISLATEGQEISL